MRVTTTKDKGLTLVRALLHGDSGVGKTTSLKTLPPDKTVIVATERGLLPLRGTEYTVLKPDGWLDVAAVPGLFRDPSAIADECIKTAVGGARILAIDSLSMVQDICAKHIVEEDRKALTLQRTNDKRDTPTGIYAEQLAQEDYGLLRTRMKRWVAAVCDLPVHVVMTCGTQWVSDNYSGMTYKAPSLAGKTALEIPAYFDLVLHMESANGSRSWRTANDGRTIAKDASGVLGELESPNWNSVFAKILGGK
jgi:hypothetical protein